MALDIVEMPDMNKENVEHPDYKRLYSEESTSAKKSKKPGFKKSISWGSKSDATTASFERKLSLFFDIRICYTTVC